MEALEGLSNGVYFGFAKLEGEAGMGHKMVLNVGNRPTFVDGDGVSGKHPRTSIPLINLMMIIEIGEQIVTYNVSPVLVRYPYAITVYGRLRESKRIRK